MSLSSLGEFGLVRRIARALGKVQAHPRCGEVILGPGDDTALISPPPGHELAVTVDAMIEWTHFRRDWSGPRDVGWKALAVNVSDLGAMGALPMGALVSVALPPELPISWVDGLYRGLAECAEEYGCPVVGGDTVRSRGVISLSVSAWGAVEVGHSVARSGAREGDLIFVTGVLGDSGAGLELLQRGGKRRGKCPARLIERHKRPRPPREAGAALAAAGIPTGMLDLSDGLASDIQHLARSSGVGARIEENKLPISDDARRCAAELKIDPLEWALHGGEDYQLLFSVPPDRGAQVAPTLGPLGVVATEVGKITRRGITLVDRAGKGKPLRVGGFRHFAG